MNDSRVHTDPIFPRNIRTAHFHALTWTDSAHCQLYSWMYTQSPFDGRAQQGQFDSFRVLDRGTESACPNCVVDLPLEFPMYLWVLHEMVENGPEDHEGGISASKEGNIRLLLDIGASLWCARASCSNRFATHILYAVPIFSIVLKALIESGTRSDEARISGRTYAGATAHIHKNGIKKCIECIHPPWS